MKAEGSKSLTEAQIAHFKLVNHLINLTNLTKFPNISLKGTDNVLASFLKAGRNYKYLDFRRVKDLQILFAYF